MTMPKMSEAFPSNYLKADDDVPDADEGSLVVTIKGAEWVDMTNNGKTESKVVLYFHETPKGLVLNKTNWATIESIMGSDDTDDWEGRKIALVAKDVEFQGKVSRGIRVKSKAPKEAAVASTMKTAKGVANLPPAEYQQPVVDEDDEPAF